MANEKRLIDANKLNDVLQNMVEHLAENGDALLAACLLYCQEVVEHQRTVEAAPVVHGRWEYEPIEFTYEKDIKCSVCGGYAERTSNYCPNCGANMMDNAMEN